MGERPMDAVEWMRHVTDDLQAVATPQRAEREKAYLKSDLRFLGATQPQIQAAVKAALPRLGKPTRADLQRLTQLCFSSDLHEHRALACLLLQRNAKQLTAADLPWLAEAIDASQTWAYVDVLAVHAAGSILARQPQEATAVLAQWAVHGNFWRRRSALLALLGAWRAKKPSEGAPFDGALFEAWSAPMLAEKEFFVRKAIGWVLREVAKRDPVYVRGYLQRHGAQMSGLSRREAEKGLGMATG